MSEKKYPEKKNCLSGLNALRNISILYLSLQINILLHCYNI